MIDPNQRVFSWMENDPEYMRQRHAVLVTQELMKRSGSVDSELRQVLLDLISDAFDEWNRVIRREHRQLEARIEKNFEAIEQRLADLDQHRHRLIDEADWWKHDLDPFQQWDADNDDSNAQDAPDHGEGGADEHRFRDNSLGGSRDADPEGSGIDLDEDWDDDDVDGDVPF